MRKSRRVFSYFLPIMTLITFNLATVAFSHGYVNNPESRSFLCNQGGNINCGSVQFEPQSVEGADGFPGAGAADGQIAAAGKSEWAPLNEQTADRWKKRAIRSGRNSFSWHFTAPHVTKNFQYFITKSNWNPNQKLTRDSFDLTSFCTIDGQMQKPPVDVTHDCVVPERQGYHVILALWDVGDTAATFYQVIDVQFGGANSPDSGAPNTGTPAPNKPAPTNPGKPNPGCNPLPTPGNKLCKAKPGSTATDQWCNLNCNHNPSFCPESLCGCEAEVEYKVNTPASETQLKNCNAVPGSGADKQWCDINCNHDPSFCPATLCQCS